MLKKITSRKFLLALIAAVGGIATALGADGNTVQLCTGIATALIGAVTYIVTEGKIDATVAAQVDTGAIIAEIKKYMDTSKSE